MVFELRKIALNIEDVSGLEERSSIATRYRLVGQGIESRWGGEIFLTRPNRPLGPTQPPILWLSGLSRR